MSEGFGTDPRRVTYPARPGLAHATALPEIPQVAVVGGGIAGLAAATALAERGARVELLEREGYLGGRVGGWPTVLADGHAATMSRGFHAFFRQYYNLRALLARADPALGQLTALEDYPLADGRGNVDTFATLPRTPLLNALAFALRSGTFTTRDLLQLNTPAALPLATVDTPGIYDRLDELDASTYLDRLNFPPAARHLAFEVFSRSFFAPPEQLSAAELATMFHLYFLGSSEGLVFDVPTEPFPTALWDPLAEHLAGRGGNLRTKTAVERIEPGNGRRFRVHTGEGAGTEVDAVVLATDVAGLQRIVAASPELGDPPWRERVAGLRNAPPYFVWRLWLDRPVAPDRPAFLGTGNQPPLDNISVLDRYEGQARAWARATGGSVVELHAYAVTGSRTGVTEQLRARLHENYPETAAAGMVDERRLWGQDCPLFAPGAFASRPGAATPEPGLVLAGDGIRIDLPVALMERAAATGITAANELLAGWGLAGHRLHSVPNHGRYAPLRALARRFG